MKVIHTVACGRCCITYLQVLIKPEIMPQADAPPSLELAPGFNAPVPTDYASMKEYIEAALPAESPIMYGMHTNAELSLLTSQVGSWHLCSAELHVLLDTSPPACTAKLFPDRACATVPKVLDCGP